MISEVASTPSDPSAPIEHETAVQAVHLDEAAKDTVPFEPTPVAADKAEARQAEAQQDSAGFAPGDGELEEELLDDEDAETVVLHATASAHEGNDDGEQETIDHAAELGRMLRDMSIDDITRSEPAEIDEDEEFEDDEEDFEEDELASSGEQDFEEDEEISGSEVSELEEGEYAEASGTGDAGSIERASAEGEARPREAGREGARRGRRDGRRGGRDRGDRGGERSASTERSAERSPERVSERSPGRSGERSSSSSGSRDRRGMAGSRGGGRDRGGRSMQSTNLPSISDLLKPGQELLVQIAKEPIAKKGARITSHIALPGRFLVFMPTVGHTGVSRKIESDAERRRLKEILLSERGDATGGFIVRTAAAGASEEELRSDLRFLLNLWADIKARSESSKSPALIYHDLNLIERILRDQVTDNFSAIWVDTENEYERVLRFLQRFPAFADPQGEAVHEGHAAVRAVRHHRGDQQGAASEGVAEVGRIDRDQPDGGAGRDRHQHRQVCRQDGAARGHDREDEPGCDSGDRAADPAARFGRHHHHRLHRHGRAQEPATRCWPRWKTS